MVPDECSLTAERLGEHGVEGIAAAVVVAVAGRGGEVALTDAVVEERLEGLLGTGGLDPPDFGERPGALLLGLRAERPQVVGDGKDIIHGRGFSLYTWGSILL